MSAAWWTQGYLVTIIIRFLLDFMKILFESALKTFLLSVTSHGWTLYPPKTINHVFKSNQSQPVNPCMKRNTFHGLFRQGRGECYDCTPKASSEIMLVVGGTKKMFFECSLLIQVQFPPIFLSMFKFLLASLLRHP